MSIKLGIVLMLVYGPLACIAQNNLKKNEVKKYNWATGLSIGKPIIKGDVAFSSGLNAGLWVSKPVKKWLSFNVKYNTGFAKGMNTIGAFNYAKNEAWADKYAGLVRNLDGTLSAAYIKNNQMFPVALPDKVYYNYKTTLNEFSIYPKFSLWIPVSEPIAIGFHLIAGVSLLHYNVKVNALDAAANTYAVLFNKTDVSGNSGQDQISTALKTGMDNTYETSAEKDGSSLKIGGYAGLGISVTFKERFEIGIEGYKSYIKSDLLDGQRWQEHAPGDAVLTRESDRLYNVSFMLGYRF